MKFKKYLCLIICTALMIAFSGCTTDLGDEEETYSSNGFSITMNNGFRKKDMQAVTYYLESRQVMFTALKESIASLADSGITADSTLQEYMDVVVEANKLDGTAVQEGNGGNVLYLNHEGAANGKSYFYTVAAVKGSDAFWLCNFICQTDIRSEYEPKFLDWAATIVVE